MPANNEKLEKSIQRFLSFFRDKLAAIEELAAIKGTKLNESNILFRKILYVALLDTLSKTTTCPSQGNRKRIGLFVKHFTDWEHHERVSLPHLVRFLSKHPDREFSSVREHAFSQLDKWAPGTVIELGSDPCLPDIEKRWPRSVPKPLDLQHLDLQHVDLFYKHRNSLVHELREPGYGIEYEDDTEPYYHSVTEADSGEQTWELVYPLKFYKRICHTAIDKLDTYYKNERINPYSSYIFGSSWIEELNR